MVTTQDLLNAVQKQPARVWGLNYTPTLEPTYSDDRDHYFEKPCEPSGGYFSRANAAVMRAVMATLNPLRCILEIGVWAGKTREQRSSTAVILRAVPFACRYIGVDKHDNGRSDYVRSYGNPCGRFFQMDSSQLAEMLRAFPVDHLIDLLWIDGGHSVHSVLTDWQFAQYVRPGGVVLMHDTAYHPGPRLVFDAVDERLFDKTLLLMPESDDRPASEGCDYGMGLLRRRADG
jgi:hypothetical protein